MVMVLRFHISCPLTQELTDSHQFEYCWVLLERPPGAISANNSVDSNLKRGHSGLARRARPLFSRLPLLGTCQCQGERTRFRPTIVTQVCTQWIPMRPTSPSHSETKVQK